jgi:hypothetical protein
MSIPPPKISATLAGTYDRYFFEHHKQHQKTYEHLGILIRELFPRDASTILDVGCGHCLLLNALQGHFSSATGVDGSDAGIPSHLRDKVAIHDLTTNRWQSEEVPRIDVVVSLETAEHLPESCARTFISELIRGSPRMVFFSAATLFQDLGNNPTHLNERPLSYWVEIFEEFGYFLKIDHTTSLRTAMVTSGLYGALAWYPKNVMVFTPERTPTTDFTMPPPILSSNPIFQLIFDRDRLEFETILLKRVQRNIRA